MSIDLDTPEVYERIDPSRMRERLMELPGQCQAAWEAASRFDLPAAYARVQRALVLGMGGSAIGGDLLRSLATLESPLPVFVHRDYDLPPFVDENSLVIASSYSGNTEEVLSATHQAVERGAKVLAMTTGGKLSKLAKEWGLPLFIIDYRAPPRAALMYSLVPLLGFLQKLGLLSNKAKEVTEATRILQSLLAEVGPSRSLAANPAKQLAHRLFGRLTIVYGGGHLAEVARRWKTQLNENAKSWAFYEVIPELNHNALVGYEFPEGLASQLFVVLLDSPSLHPRHRARLEITAEVLDRAGVEHQTIESRGQSPLAQMLSTVLFGDYVSYYLAILNERDPSPVEVIDYLKRRLSEI